MISSTKDGVGLKIFLMVPRASSTSFGAGAPKKKPLKSMGSADLHAAVAANAVALFSTGNQLYQSGFLIDTFLW